MAAGRRADSIPAMNPTPLIATAAVAGVLALAPAASAQTFCVNYDPCPGTDKATIQDALVAAQGNGAEDVVRIGPKPTSYVGQATYVSNEKVTIIGAGPDQTRLSPDAGAAITMVLHSPSSQVRDLTLNVRDSPSSLGLETDGTATNVRIRYPGSEFDLAGVRLKNGGVLEDSVVDMDGGKGVQRLESGTATIRDTTISSYGAGVEAVATGAGTNLQRVRVTSVRAPLFLSGSNTLTDVVARMTGSAMDAGLYAGPGANVVAHHLTLVGGAAGNALSAYATSGTTAQITLRNSIVMGFSRTFARQADGAGIANIGISFSRFLAVNTYESGNGAITVGTGTTAAAPQFVDAGTGDYRLRGDSALIDAGDPQNVLGPDISGQARPVDGDGANGARADMGAYEYRRQAPVVQVTVPSTLAIGAAGAFSATATDPDGDPITGYGWTFGDGATASGAAAQHAYADAGARTVTATATDIAGVTGSASAQVDVPAPPPADPPVTDPPVGDPPVTDPPQGDPPLGDPPVKDTTPPAFASISATRKSVKYSLSEPAKVTVRLSKAAPGKRSGPKCVKPTLKLRRARSCTRWVAVVRPVTAAQSQGLRSVSFKKLALRTGTYRVRLVAVDAALNKSAPRIVRFRVK